MQSDIDQLFTPEVLKEFIPDGATLIGTRSIVLEGQKGGVWEYELSEERLDLKITMRMLQYAVFYDNRLVFLQFSTGGKPEDRREWLSEFEKNRPLFGMVANSLVIVDKYNN